MGRIHFDSKKLHRKNWFLRAIGCFVCILLFYKLRRSPETSANKENFVYNVEETNEKPHSLFPVANIEINANDDQEVKNENPEIDLENPKVKAEIQDIKVDGLPLKVEGPDENIEGHDVKIEGPERKLDSSEVKVENPDVQIDGREVKKVDDVALIETGKRVSLTESFD